jgi:hypothetical protein
MSPFNTTLPWLAFMKMHLFMKAVPQLLLSGHWRLHPVTKRAARRKVQSDQI